MEKRRRVFMGLLLLCLLAGSAALAQPQISGPQSGTLGPGTYLVVGDIRVLPGTTLTIVPRTTFLHNGHWFWYIYGQLNASGAEGDSIYFVRQQPIADHRWRGIRFQSGSSPASMIDYCVIDNAEIPSGTSSTLVGGGIFTDGVAFTVSNTRISNCDAYWGGGGMYIKNTAGMVIDHCLIVDNTATLGANGGGIYLYNCTNAQIKNCVIARNSDTGT